MLVPAWVWVWIAQATSGRAICTAPWITKPAGLMLYSVGLRMVPSSSTLTSDEAVISSNKSP
jgi:hypothetical protein